MAPTLTDRRNHAAAILAKHDRNEWSGSASLDDLAVARYAVVIERNEDSWVLAAQDHREIASYAHGTLEAQVDAEWLETVYEISSGDEMPYTLTRETTFVFTIDGKPVQAATIADTGHVTY